jgi:S-adenosylmethionine:tRNA ribosyltransferase-isomerase
MLRSYSTNLGFATRPASAPAEIQAGQRDQIKLLLIDPLTGEFAHRRFTEIINFFNAGDLLVVNNSSTIPASLPALIAGKPARLNLAARLTNRQVVAELRTAEGGPSTEIVPAGTSCSLLDGAHQAISAGQVINHFHPRSRFWTIATDEDWYGLAPAIGDPVRYHYVDRPYPISYYQTLFGRIPGSVEMASASRPFTSAITAALKSRGVTIAPLTLHTTLSSHELGEEDDDLPLVPEWYDIPLLTRRLITGAKRRGTGVVALGTTVARALESWAASGRASGWTTHLITPATPPEIVSGLVTGLHDSFTSHLWLLYAFVRPEILKSAYRDADARGYAWHEFGDLSLISPGLQL